MQATVKAGTRCECSKIGNVCHDGGGYGEAGCNAEAVRMVTVRGSLEPDWVARGATDPYLYNGVPMCSACAAFHEARQKERV